MAINPPPGMHKLYADPIVHHPKQKELTFGEKAKNAFIDVASRIDAFFLKTPVLLWVSLLQTAKIAIKFTACVLTLNQSRHLCESWSFSGLLTDAVFLYSISKKVTEIAKVIIDGPHEKYQPSYKALLFLLGEVFGGEYHNELKGVTLDNISDMTLRPK